ncbi:protein TIFY 10B-like isoform X2 [Aristolochia californica]|uniref:protein TIFY 10B-like isoform X2 n=1 Tax=Aristolochia californica TaxID=171875 RepID=UPI0035E1B781
MSGPEDFSGFSGRKMINAPEKSTFSQTCSLLSQYLKEKGSFGDVSFGMTCSKDDKGKSEPYLPSATMDLLPKMSAAREEPERNESASERNQAPLLMFTQPAGVGASPSDKDDQRQCEGRPGGATESAQMTIFYAGRVLVFDNFPADKAGELELLARKGCSQNVEPATSLLPTRGSSKSMGPPPSVPTRTNSQSIGPPVSVQNKGHGGSISQPSLGNSQNLGPVSFPSMGVGSSHNVGSSSSLVHERVTPSQQHNLNEPPPPFEQHNPDVASSSGTNPLQDNIHRPADGSDLPIARKVSLHRFLAKRKDRINSKAPYPVNQAAAAQAKPEESNSWLGLATQSD